MALGRVAIREVLSHRGRNLLTVGGISLGVALVVAVSLMNRTITHSFSEAVKILAGQAVLEVYGGDAGFAEGTLEVVRSEPGVRHAAALITGNVFVDDPSGEPLAIVGVDVLEEGSVRTYEAAGLEETPIQDPLVFLNSPDSLLVTETFARQRGIKVGDALTVLTPTGKHRLTIRGILRSKGVAHALGGTLGVMDVFAAQRLFGKDGKFDRISIILEDGLAADAVARSLKRHLPAGITVQRPEQRRAELERLITALRFMLSAGGFLALVLGMCMVYSTLSTAVARRQRELGVLRALGSRRRDIVGMILSEAAVMGVVGSGVGCGLGVLLASCLTATFSGGPVVALAGLPLAQYGASQPSLEELLKSLSGIGAALVAGWLPARHASRVTVIEALRPGLFERVSAPGRGRNTLVGGACLLLTAALIVLGVLLRSTLVTVGATILLAISFLALAASGAVFLATNGERFLSSILGVRGSLVATNVARNSRGTALTAAFLAGGMSLHITIATVLSSVKGSVLAALSQGLHGTDLIVSSAFLRGGRFTSPIDGSLAEALQALPGIEAVRSMREVYQLFRKSQVLVQAHSASFFAHPHYGRLMFVAGDPETALRLVAKGKAVLVSHNFAFHFDVQPGSTLNVKTPRGTAMLPVAGVVISYDDNTGTILISRRAYLRWWGDRLVNYFGIHLVAGTDPQAVKESILRRFHGDYRLRILNAREYLENVAENIERGFRFDWVLEAVILVVLALSLADTLLVSVLARTREIAVLRAIGAYRGDVLRLVILEGLVIAGLGAVTGVVGGALIATVYVQVHAKYLFGWIMEMYFPFAALATAVGLICTVAVAAAAYPARRASCLPVVQGLTYE